MTPYGIELFIEERQRQLDREVEQQRLWETARREAGTATAMPYRPRARMFGAQRRVVQIAWAW